MLSITSQNQIGRVYQQNKWRRTFLPPQPPAAHPAPDDTVRPIKKKKKPDAK